MTATQSSTMPRIGFLVLGALCAVPSAAAAGSLPRGVGPEFIEHYGSSSTFSCITHPDVQIPSSLINDNSCDCPDGSDEPGTSACSHLSPLSPPQPLPGSSTGTTNTTSPLPGFWCANEGHVGAYVPFAYVNDGVCDYELCCDGSEEYAGAGGVRCPDRCAEIGREWRRAEEERKARKERSLKKKKTLLKEAKEMRRRVQVKIDRLGEEMTRLEIKREELEKKYEEVQKQEKGRMGQNGGGAFGKTALLIGTAKNRVEELRLALLQIFDHRNALQERVAELEGILSKFKDEYNPNFNDEGVKSAVKAWEDYAARTASERMPDVPRDQDVREIAKEDGEMSGVNWAQFEDEETSDTDILYTFEAYLPGSVREYFRTKLALLRVWLIENGMLADPPTAGESRLEAAAREALESAEADLSKKNQEAMELRMDMTTDYGVDDIFRALKGKCVTADAGEYEYEMCWLDKTSQKAKKGGGKTNMGKFERMDVELVDEEDRGDGRGLGGGRRLVLRFERGQGCWNGPQRRTDVYLGCSETEELWRVSESEKCVYRMEVGTPAACGGIEKGVVVEEETGTGAGRAEKDEL